MGISLTERAAREVTGILKERSLPETTCLRLAVKGGGCSGFSYSLDLVDAKGEHDEEFTSNGVRIVCDPKSYLYLNGTTIDFRDEIMGRGFVFDNPNASSKCGCGSSFSA